MEQSGLARLAPLAGVVFLALIAAWFILVGETPDADDSTQEVIDFWSDNEDEGQIGGALGALASAALVWFAGSLRVTLRRAATDEGRLSALAFGGAVMMAVGVALFASLEFALGDTVGDVPPGVTQTLSVMDSELFFIGAAGGLVLLLASGIAILRTGALPKWLGWIAILLAIVSVTPAGFIGFLGGILWVAVTGVVIYLGQRAAPPTASTPPTAAPPPPA